MAKKTRQQILDEIATRRAAKATPTIDTAKIPFMDTRGSASQGRTPQDKPLAQNSLIAPKPQTGLNELIIPKEQTALNAPVMPKPQEGLNELIIPKAQPKATVPTASSPVVEIPATPKPEVTPTPTPTQGMSDEERMVQIGMKQYNGERLDPADVEFLIRQQLKPPAGADVSPITNELQAQIGETQTQFEARQREQEAQRAKLVGEQQDLLQGQVSGQQSQLQSAADSESAAAQGALSFKGFGRSTTANQTAQNIQQRYNEQKIAVQQAADLQMQLFQKQLQQADETELAPFRERIDKLRGAIDKITTDNAVEMAKLNSESGVNGLEAISNVLELLPSELAASVNKDVTELINDGYLYGLQNGVPVRINAPDGKPIQVGVNDEEESSIKFTAPKTDAFGNIVSPGYLFDETTGELNIVDPSTGQQTSIGSGYSAKNAINVYKNFDEYTALVGNGNVITGSPYHSGFEVDIDGEIGDPIVAFAGGKVVEAKKSDSGFGNTVVIESADGTRTRYAHLNDINVSVGQNVDPGGFLGTMGNTGATIPLGKGDGSHLHIEARDAEGKLVDLGSLQANNTMNRPTGTGKSVNALRAEAFNKGYTTDDEIMNYINSVNAGITPPSKTATEERGQALDDYTTLANQFKPLKQEISALEQGFAAINGFDINHKNPSSDQTLIFSFMKVLDPTSVVREGEFNTAKNNASILEGFAANWRQAIDGAGMITPKQRQNILQEMNRLYQSKKGLYDAQLKDAIKVGEAFGIDPELYLGSFINDLTANGKGDIVSQNVIDSMTPNYQLSAQAMVDIKQGLYTMAELKAVINSNPKEAERLGLITK